MTRIIALFLLLVIPTCLLYPAEKDLYAVDQKILLIPPSKTFQSEKIAEYINSVFSTESEKIRAIYVWITQNIRYDMYSNPTSYLSQAQKVSLVLRSREAVCDGYAALFQDLCSNSGIDCQLIKGYTRKDGVINKDSHVWCACRINGAWKLFDPTWGAGFVRNGTFVQRRNNYYFMTPALVLINTHMPFDPIWQLLNHPLTNREFMRGVKPSLLPGNSFNFNDSIANYENQNQDQKLVSSVRRITNNGITNPLISKRISSLLEEMRVNNENRLIEQYNLAVRYYSDAVKSYNKVVYYRNPHYQPLPKTIIVSDLIFETENYIKSAHEVLARICNIPSGMHSDALSLLASVEKLKGRLDKQKNQ